MGLLGSLFGKKTKTRYLRNGRPQTKAEKRRHVADRAQARHNEKFNRMFKGELEPKTSRKVVNPTSRRATVSKSRRRSRRSSVIAKLFGF